MTILPCWIQMSLDIKQLGKYIVHRRSIAAGVNACCKRRPVERRCSFFYWENLMDIKPDFTTCTFNATFGNPIPLPHTLGFLPFLRRSNTVNSAFVPHHLRCPVLVHNLACTRRVILPVTKPPLELLALGAFRNFYVDFFGEPVYNVIRST